MSWFDLRREVREVTRSDIETGQGMALCRMHTDRFTVPVGWSLKLLNDTAVKDAGKKASTNDAAKKAQTAKAVTPETPKKPASKKAAAPKAKTTTKKSASAKKPSKSKKAKAAPAKTTKSEKASADQAKKTEAKKTETKKTKVAEAEAPRAPEVNAHARETAWFVPDSFEDDAVSEDDTASPLLGSAAEGSLLARAFNGPSVNDEATASGDDESGTELPFPPHGDELSVS